jgi:uncharacterized membrane protein YgdD (TMEM256/DUF423 family)
MNRSLVAAGALLAGAAVLLGAFGTHALTGRLDTRALGWWQTAVQYQAWNGVAVLALGLSGPNWFHRPAWMLAAGALIFAATLYIMALGGPHWLGAVTPVGGTFMIAGWLLLVWRAIRTRD